MTIARSLVLLTLIGSLAIAAVPQTRWRAHVLLLHLAGKIPDIELLETIEFMLPGSDQSLAFLVEKRNPYAVFNNFRTSEADIRAGAELFGSHCVSCHGAGASGSQFAPALTGRRFKHGESDWALYRSIRLGIPNTAMQPSVPMTPTQRWQLISYIRSLAAEGPASASRQAPIPPVRVAFDEIVKSDEHSEDWLTFAGSYSSVRHSRLKQIDRSNVPYLSTRWIRQIPGIEFAEVTPLVRAGIMYVSLPPCTVQALDAKTGAILWTFTCTLGENGPGNFTNTNTRGVAILDEKIFVATWDARLFALSAQTGKELWRTTVDDEAHIYYIGSAPIALRDQVAVSVATRRGGRGHLVVFDAETGKERWRFWSTPAPGEPGNETWKGDSWQTGGGSIWLSGSYDPETDLLYWPVGNPKPDYDTDARLGDNLYTNSLVVLRGATGELVWHFQATPGDNKDWDGSQIPVLVDLPTEKGVRKAVLWANRNGFYYVLDRRSGELLTGTPFVQQNWAEGLDAKGRPIAKKLTGGIGGDLLYPGNVGATNWWPPTYYAERNWLIVPVLEQGMVFFPSASSPPLPSGLPFYTAVRALDATTGRLVWEHRHGTRFTDNATAGLMSTDGGLVFGGDTTAFYAYDIDTGDVLWSQQTGGTAHAAPMTYAVDGEQMIAVASGRDLIAFALPAALRQSKSSPSVFVGTVPGGASISN